MRSPTYAVLFASLGLLALGYRFVAAQDAYPSRTVTLTIGFAAGGNGDIIARIVAEGLTPRLGQPVVVEPRPGAGGNTASARLAKSAAGRLHADRADRRPRGVRRDLQVAAVRSGRRFPDDLDRRLSVLHDSGPRRQSDQDRGRPRSPPPRPQPGKLTYSSVGVGSTQHLAGEWFGALTGVQMTHVPYRSGSATMTDLLGGQIDVAFDTITVVDPQFRAGKAHVLGVTSGTRWWSTPDVAPVADAVPGYDVRTWVGIAAPKGLPEPVLKKLNDAMREPRSPIRRWRIACARPAAWT